MYMCWVLMILTEPLSEAESLEEEIRRLREDNARLTLQLDNCMLRLKRNEKEVARLSGEVEQLKADSSGSKTEKDSSNSNSSGNSNRRVPCGYSMLGCINVADVQDLTPQEWVKVDAELIELREAVLNINTEIKERTKMDTIPAKTEYLCDKFGIRYDVTETEYVYWRDITNVYRPNRDRFLELLLYRRFYLENYSKNGEGAGGPSSYRLVFWLNFIYRMLEARELWNV